jgi:arylsulfatase A-like enzyme
VVNASKYTDAVPGTPRYVRMLQYLWNQGPRPREEDYQVARVFLSAMEWVEANRAYGPFYLYIDSFDPHEPWDPPPAYADLYFKDNSVKDYIWPGGEPMPSQAAIERTKALYYGEVTLVDKWFGHFMEKLADLRLLDETVVILTSDHGTELMDRDRFCKSEDHLQWFNTQVHMIIRHPQQQHAGKRVAAFVQHQDIPPTVMHLMGLEAEASEGLDGCNLWPLVSGQTDKVRDFIIAGWGQHALVRDKNFSYVVDFEQTPRRTDSGGFTVTQEVSGRPTTEELYDLTKDPLETTNVAAKEDAALRRMRSLLEGFLGQELPAYLRDRVRPYEYPRLTHLRANPKVWGA